MKLKCGELNSIKFNRGGMVLAWEAVPHYIRKSSKLDSGQYASKFINSGSFRNDISKCYKLCQVLHYCHITFDYPNSYTVNLRNFCTYKFDAKEKDIDFFSRIRIANNPVELGRILSPKTVQEIKNSDESWKNENRYNLFKYVLFHLTSYFFILFRLSFI